MVLHNVMLLIVGLLISILLQGSTPALILSKLYTVIVMLVPTVTITLLQICVFIYVYGCYLTCYFIPGIVFILFLLYFCTTYTHQKSLATLQPVKKRGTSIHWNGHNIPNTACILFKLGTMNNRHMPNSKPMKV